MRSTDDTIVALSTPAGPSPRAIVRLSGPEAFPILDGLVAEPHAPLATLPCYSALDVPLRLRAAGPRIPASLYLMRAPRSYTRQDIAEIHTIGSAALLRMLLDALVGHGARIAEPGEFTRRAFLAGRVDLAQAEAVLAVIQASSVGEHRAAARALQGAASRRIRELHDALVGLRAQVEAAIDFAEHDIELVSPQSLLDGIAGALANINDELKNADAGALPPEGIRVALCGLPNAGKSSLFNALLDRPRAIVTPIPGTTRDAVAEPLAIGGVHFRLYDTAGLVPSAAASSWHAARGTRDDAEAIDAEAMTRSRGLIGGTHIALVVVDASQPLTDAERQLWADIHAPHKLLVLNKSDLPPAITDADAASLLPSSPPHAARGTRHAPPVLHLSALTGAGLPELRSALAALVASGRVEASPSDLTWNARHREALRHAREALDRAHDAIVTGLGAEFVAADLRGAHDALAAITGQVAPDDLLDLIFAQFCIGK